MTNIEALPSALDSLFANLLPFGVDYPFYEEQQHQRYFTREFELQENDRDCCRLTGDPEVILGQKSAYGKPDVAVS